MFSSSGRAVSCRAAVWHLPVAILVSLFLPWSMAHATDNVPGDHRVERPTEPVTLIELRLDRGLHLGEFRNKGLLDRDLAPVILHLYRRGKTITSGWAMAEALGNRGKVKDRKNNEVLSEPLSLDTAGLTCQDDRLSGKVIRVQLDNARAWDAEVWTIDAAISGTTITGTFAAARPEHLERQAGGVTYDGSVAGRILTAEEWAARAAANRLQDGADWPCWLGPDANGRAVPYDGELVKRWEDARFAWRAEVDLVPGSPDMGHPAGGTRHDYNGPVVADGKVYLFIMEPAVDGPMWEGPKKGFRAEIESQPRGERQAAWILASLVNDVGYCFDAATGALLWRTVFPRRGGSGNFVGKGKGGHWSTPVVADGRVYWCGSNSRVYCVDAGTGEPLWEQVLVPGVVESFDQSVERYLADGREGGIPYKKDLCNHLQASPCMAGGVLICPAKDQLGGDGSGLYGLDPVTGAVLWGPIPRMRGASSPFRWRHEGKEYVLTPAVRCIDPQTGRELWSWNGMKGGIFSGAVFDGLYLPRAGGGRGKSRTPESAGPILRLDAEGATLVGAIPEAHGGPNCWEGVGATCDDAGNFFFCLGPGKAKHSGLYACDREGQLLAKCTGGQYKHFLGYGTLVFSNDRVFVPGVSSGITMMNWDSEQHAITDAGRLGINYYWCSPHAVADGRLFFRTNEGLVCYDMRVAQ